MNKIAIIYKSKYGSTKKYAQWIANESHGDLLEVSEVEIKDLLLYNTVIFGGGLYASGINGVSIITKNFERLKDKNIIVFTVGLASTDDIDIFKPIIEKNFSNGMAERIKFFHFRGGIDYKNLSFTHKAMMAMLKKIVSKKKPDEMSKDDKDMLESYGKKVDFTNIDAIEPLIMYIKGLNK
ncbi:flavodoxin domain-containing protein [Clostridiisalibacter paucivorans]|uniref:flavodoxin domain-containing protein n=1 Tax=Clostridiisalibacter paucivorans TaxID=408753 RepID=UPI000551A6FF|nr:flavodoxin domain-containing protein [Clostridiisalibacter paucivorans]